MQDKIFYLDLQPRAFEAIKNKTKTIEVRANKNHASLNSVNQMQVGDKIVFNKITTDEKLQCVITRINLYSNVRDLLLAEGINNTLSSGKNLEDGIKSIESISDYKEQIEKNGVFAIQIV